MSVIVSGTTSEGLTTHVQVGRHRLVADEPVDLGGRDSGPAPFDFLLTALGACTVMTLRLYATRKGWPLGEVEVALSHKARASGAQRDVFSREIQLGGPLSPEQRTRLLEIAERCPVGRTLAAGVEIQTAVVGPASVD